MTPIPPSLSQKATVRLNVGGHKYTISCSTIELYPNSMIARLVSKEWNNDEDTNNDNVVFIDRDGHRFRYVLDYMRDQEINLPMTESLQAIKKELVYFGLWLGDNGEDNDVGASPKITVGTPVEAGKMMAAIGGNMREELDQLNQDIVKFNKKIEERECQIKAVNLARSLFERSIVQHESQLKSGDSFLIEITQHDELDCLYHSVKTVMEFFKEKLASYGLLLVLTPGIGLWTRDPVNLELKSLS